MLDAIYVSNRKYEDILVKYQQHFGTFDSLRIDYFLVLFLETYKYKEMQHMGTWLPTLTECWTWFLT